MRRTMLALALSGSVAVSGCGVFGPFSGIDCNNAPGGCATASAALIVTLIALAAIANNGSGGSDYTIPQ
jgi:hypothetical protein